MKHLRVRITAEGREAAIHPMYGVLANAPYVERATALQWNFTADGFGILHYVEGDPDRFEAALSAVPQVLGYDIERTGEDACYAYVRDATTEELRELFAPITHGGIVVIPPIVYHEDGTVGLSLFGPDRELQEGVESIPDLLDVDIEEITGLGATSAAADARLSDRQREAVETALELGYYTVPREASHEDVATAMGCAPSTAAEHLRKAESKTLRAVYRG